MADEFCSTETGRRCVVVTGRGYADVATRLFVRSVAKQLGLRVVGLADCDPFGIEILSVYAHGSIEESFEAACMAVPQLEWIGMRVTDGTSAAATSKLEERDVEKINSLLEREWITRRPEWRMELQRMLAMQTKFEIEALSVSELRLLSRSFLPQRLGVLLADRAQQP